MIRIASILLSLALASNALAARPADLNSALRPAQQALAAADYRTAYARYARLAAGNPLAQFSLGLFHQYGWGRPVDAAQACRWYQKAAEKNIPTAQHLLGDCLLHGTHQAADPAQALLWYRKAAGNGHLLSLCAAGELYIQGRGVAKDVAQGLALCTQAAQADSTPTMLKLANYYREGKEVPPDLAAARYWYQQAAERHSSQAQYRLGLMLGEAQGGAADLPAARFWLETAAAAGYADAYLPTAILYANADPDPASGALAPEHLAKLYLWLSAAKARAPDDVQRAEITRIEAMVLAVMPASWRPGLDQQVAAHLAKYENISSQHN